MSAHISHRIIARPPTEPDAAGNKNKTGWRYALLMVAVLASIAAVGLWRLGMVPWPADDARAATQRQPDRQALAASVGDLEFALTPARFIRRPRLGRGDRLIDLLLAFGVPRGEAHAATTALKKVYSPRRLRAGQRLELAFGPVGDEDGRFLGLTFDADGDRVVAVERAPGGFRARATKKILRRTLAHGAGTIRSSLYEAGLGAGVPPGAVIELIHIFSFDVDFQRDIWRGDKFEIVYENLYDLDGKLARQGEVLYGSLTLRGVTLRLYRHTPAKGRTDYFNERGESMRKLLMRTPIDGARLSSRYGRRRHPILGYTRMHRGVDFAAPRGTPIYAAGDGSVVRAGRYGGYGRYIRIRHNSTYSTAYAHMRAFARGVRRGRRVRQGQTIGYVGSTGRSTGPHLHYEIHYRGRQINPLTLRLPTGQKLKGAALVAFQNARAELDRRLAALRRGGVVKLAKP